MSAIRMLTYDSPEVRQLCRKDKRLAKAISQVGPITYTLARDEYAFLVHEIIEQMLSVKAGGKIYDRLNMLCDGGVIPESISALSDEDIRGAGVSSAKAAYIRNMTNAVLSGDLDFAALRSMPDKDVIKMLTSLRGIGDWTAKMYLIFVLDRQDVLPFEDGAFLQSYRWLYKTADCSPEAVKKKCAKWKPYSSIAARYLYRVLDLGLTKKEFHLFK